MKETVKKITLTVETDTDGIGELLSGIESSNSNIIDIEMNGHSLTVPEGLAEYDNQ